MPGMYPQGQLVRLWLHLQIPYPYPNQGGQILPTIGTVEPKFSDTLTLSQPGGADSAHHHRGQTQIFPVVTSLFLIPILLVSFHSQYMNVISPQQNVLLDFFEPHCVLSRVLRRRNPIRSRSFWPNRKTLARKPFCLIKVHRNLQVEPIEIPRQKVMIFEATEVTPVVLSAQSTQESAKRMFLVIIII